jgi:aminoglycoside phosphotransferase (APT) family kinase protein
MRTDTIAARIAVMDDDELRGRLVTFCRAKYGRDDLDVIDVFKMPGHAGFAWGFTVVAGTEASVLDHWFIRLPPPNVQWRGTADVLRQAAVLRALDGTTVPHCSVQWADDDLAWFGCPYFIVPQLRDGDVGGTTSHWTDGLDAAQRRDMGVQAMQALAAIHRVDWKAVPYLGEPIPLDDDVVRWDRFMEKVAEPDALARQTVVRALLLDRLPPDAPVGIFHGDYQFGNLYYRFADARLLAVLDWELVGIGATLNDVGWIATFADPPAWRHENAVKVDLPLAEELVGIYDRSPRSSSASTKRRGATGFPTCAGSARSPPTSSRSSPASTSGCTGGASAMIRCGRRSADRRPRCSSAPRNCCAVCRSRSPPPTGAA